MRKKHRLLLLGVTLGHLTLVALGAGSVSLRPLGPPGGILAYYGLLSGADSGYGFFAPGVTGQLRARFDVTDSEGHLTTTSLETGASHEADIRAVHVVDHFWNELDNDAKVSLQRALGASLAGKIIGRHPGARQVVVRLEVFEPVSMDEFRRGGRPQWTPAYEAKFIPRRSESSGVER